ncbi:MAG TPA: selenocysteine-specific translation elongation factor [Vicinamibacterales bacterium]|nr:selenocysteine-specific translation elongation factor [Vicinamibacterales bacterium]
MSHIIVGTAGHIDHGKTALVKALTGIDTDRLKEEKERGITIDLGFASLALDAETTIGFVDVPGHERFIKNMLAGVGGIDVVMLVIAADEAVMPQTREHLAICELLRVQKGLTVLTKIDAVEPDIADLVEVEVQEFLKRSFLANAPILRVSAHTGEGLPALVARLTELAATAVPRDAARMFRLPIDRCFTMKGFGAVAAGTLIAGRIRRDQEVELLPPRKPARVRGIQVHGVSVDEARAGQRTALNLQRVDLSEIERGMVLTVPGLFSPSSTFDVQLELLAAAEHPLPSRKRIRFHVGTTELIGHAVLLGQDALEPGASAFARIRLERPAFALPGDRFIIRQYSPMTTLGGGEILDAQPPRRRRSDPALVERLRIFQAGSTSDKIRRLVAEAGSATTDETALVARLGLAPEAVRGELQQLAHRGDVRILSSDPFVVAAAEAFDRAAAKASDAVTTFHAAEPLLAGIGREDLKARVFADASPVFFRGVLDDLASKQVVTVDQDVIRAFGRSVTLQGADAAARTQLSARFRELGLQAPPPDEVAAGVGVDRATARKIIQLLLKDQALVKINEAMIVDRAALQKLIDDVRARKTTSPRLGVGEFKELTGLSRKFAVPLLEYLDGQRVTRRVGDERIIL